MDVGTLADLVKLGPDSLMQHAKLMVRLENARGNLTSFLRQEIGQTGSMEFEEKLYNEAYNILQSKGTYEDYFTFAESLTGFLKDASLKLEMTQDTSDKMDIDAKELGPVLNAGNTGTDCSQKKLDTPASKCCSQVDSVVASDEGISVKVHALNKVDCDPSTGAFENKETGEKNGQTDLNSSSFTLKYHDELNNLSEIFDEPFETSDVGADENSALGSGTKKEHLKPEAGVPSAAEANQQNIGRETHDNSKSDSSSSVSPVIETGLSTAIGNASAVVGNEDLSTQTKNGNECKEKKKKHKKRRSDDSNGEKEDPESKRLRRLEKKMSKKEKKDKKEAKMEIE